MSYADLTNAAKDVSKKIKLQIEEVQGSSCFTSFNHYELSREKISAMLKKRQSLIEIITEAKTNDNVIYRIFIIIVTNRRNNQLKLNSYVPRSRARLLRKRISSEIMTKTIQKSSGQFVHEAITDKLNEELGKLAKQIVPGAQL